jgi:hypothetical protein
MKEECEEFQYKGATHAEKPKHLSKFGPNKKIAKDTINTIHYTSSQMMEYQE